LRWWQHPKSVEPGASRLKKLGAEPRGRSIVIFARRRIRTVAESGQGNYKPDGFLGKAREGVYDEESGASFIAALEKIKLPDGATIDRRLVAPI
jgi:hypothetical protein